MTIHRLVANLAAYVVCYSVLIGADEAGTLATLHRRAFANFLGLINKLRGPPAVTVSA